TLAFAEQRPNVFGHKAGNFKSALAAGVESHLANVVAVIKSDRAITFQREHGFDMPPHRFQRAFYVALRIYPAQFDGAYKGNSGRHVTVQRIVRARLIRDGINLYPPTHYLGKNFGAIADQAYREGALLCARVFADVQGFVQIPRQTIAITGAHAALD